MKKLICGVFSLLLFVSPISCKSKKNVPKDLTSVSMELSSQPYSIDPVLAQENQGSLVIDNIFEGLTRSDPKTLEPLPGMAERWTISDDGRIYTFYLRKNAKWHDGSPLTAHDFVQTWTRKLLPETASAYAFILYPIQNAEAFNAGQLKDPTQLGFKAIDDYTLVVMLKDPTPYFLGLTSFFSYSPTPHKVVAQYGDQWTRPEHILCNGPFYLAEHVLSQKMVLKKNPHYWDAGVVRLETVNLPIIDDQETAFKKYEDGDLDFLQYIPVMKVSKLRKREDFVAVPFLTTDFEYFNVKKPPFNDKRVRQAFNLAIDRNTLATLLDIGRAPYGNVVPPGIPGYKPPSGLTFDPEKARTLLAEAGYKDGKNFPPVTYSYNTGESNKIVAEILQGMWKQHLGVNVALANSEWKVFLKMRREGEYEICRGSWIGDYIDPNTFLDMFMTTSTFNDSFWSHPDFDLWMQQAAQTRDPVSRMALLAKAEALLIEEAPLLPILQGTKNHLKRPYVKNLHGNLQDNSYFREVYIEN